MHCTLSTIKRYLSLSYLILSVVLARSIYGLRGDVIPCARCDTTIRRVQVWTSKSDCPVGYSIYDPPQVGLLVVGRCFD